MGIKSLLPKFATIENRIEAAELSGYSVGIDASTWLYNILHRYSIELLKKTIDPKETYVKDFCTSVDLLIRNDVTPVVVFDGADLPAKQSVKEERLRNKREARNKALEAIEVDNEIATKLNADRAISVDDEVTDQIMQALDRKGIHWIQAPFEADAQLLYMANVGVVDYVISTDSDLLVFNTPRVIFRWNINAGYGNLIEYKDLYKCITFPFSPRKFVLFCIITGCDYLESLRGIGPCLSEKFMTQIEDKDVFKEIPNIFIHVGRREPRPAVPVIYPFQVKKALHVFEHQAVYDVSLGKIVPSTPVLSGTVPRSFDVAAGLTPDAQVPPHSANMNTIWTSLQDLDASGLSDMSWRANDTIDDEDIPVSRTTRYGGRTVAIKAEDSSSMVWTPPCLPVLKVHLVLCESEDGTHTAIHINDSQLEPDLPTSLFCTESCWIEVNQIKRFLLWKWTPMFNESDLPSSEGTQYEEDLGEEESDSDSEEEGDDVVVLNEDVDTDNEDLGEHTLYFKVVGVTYEWRQNYIECAKELMSQGKLVPVTLIPEENNPVDPGGISVVFDTGAEQFGKKCVGYLPKEFKEIVTRYLNQNKICNVSIQHIKLRTQFNPVGLYILLQITKKGRWPNFVIQKCLKAR